MPRAHGDAGSGVPGTRWSARTIGADRARGGSPGRRPPGGRRCHSMTAPAHRVGDLRDRPPAQDPRRWWTPEWWRISRAVIPPAYRPMIIESNPPRPPLAHGATGRGVNEPARSRGTTGLEGAHLASRWSWSWSRPRALAAGRCRRLSLLIAQVLGQLGPQAAPPEPPRGRAGSSPRAPVITGLSGVDPPGTGRPGPRSRATAEPHRARRRACSSPQSPSIGVSPSIRAYTDH